MGVILVAAILVVPVAAASQVARSFKESLLVSIIAAELAVILGITVAYAYDLAAGETIVLAAIGVYVVAMLLGKTGTGDGDTAASGTEQTN